MTRAVIKKALPNCIELICSIPASRSDYLTPETLSTQDPERTNLGAILASSCLPSTRARIDAAAIYRRWHDQSLGVVSMFADDIDAVWRREDAWAHAKTGGKGLTSIAAIMRDPASACPDQAANDRLH